MSLNLEGETSDVIHLIASGILFLGVLAMANLRRCANAAEIIARDAQLEACFNTGSSPEPRKDFAETCDAIPSGIPAQMPPRDPRALFSPRSLILLATTAFMLLMFVKFGYVRHDIHESGATTLFALTCIIFLAPLLLQFRKRTESALAISLIIISIIMASASIDGPRAIPRLPINLLRGFTVVKHSAGGFFRLIFVRNHLQKEFAKQTQKYANWPLANGITGTVDAYPWHQIAILSRHLDYQPRPVIQGYAAYTPQLARENADFLRSDRAPDSLLFQIITIDAQYPSQPDGLSWPEILTRYDLADADPQHVMLLLKHSARPRAYSFTSLQNLQASFGEWIDVPQSDDPIWITLNVSNTTWGALRQTLFKPPYLTLEAKTQNGAQHVFRVIPATAQAGFLLSPLIRESSAFATLYSTQWNAALHNHQVTQIRLGVYPVAPLSNASFHPTVALSFSRLIFPHTDISDVPGITVAMAQSATRPANQAATRPHDPSDHSTLDWLIYLNPNAGPPR